MYLTLVLVHSNNAFADLSHCLGGTERKTPAAIWRICGDRFPTLISYSIQEILSSRLFDLNVIRS